ncbi:hypothetical protein NUW58_g8270 [Xylaria curta]|uniref:Uncharacterized protein n=1 Tax=Xylaria curta TaxID=42375 RepID=A0ACC1NBB7_9PEZI|nr:hypothetical protein NUW58_g8270 [Xylaria curta]
MEVETLIPQLQDTLSEIRAAVNGLSTKKQDEDLDQLEQKRERLLADLQASFEKQRQELETKRRTKIEDIKKKRKQEDEERAARRRQEDVEFEKANSNEDKKRQQKKDSEAGSIEDEIEHEMDEVEEAAQKMIEDGKKKLHDLEEKRRDLNRRIDEQLTQPLPTTPPRTPRKRDTPKKKRDRSRPNGNVDDSASVNSRDNDSSPERAAKSRTTDSTSKTRTDGNTDESASANSQNNDSNPKLSDRVDAPSKSRSSDPHSKSRTNGNIEESISANSQSNDSSPKQSEKPGANSKSRTGDSHSKPRTNGDVDESTSVNPQNNDSSAKQSDKAETRSKSRTGDSRSKSRQSATDSSSKSRPTIAESRAKSPDAKKDGEPPFQDRSNGPLQGAKESAKDLPISFAEALKNESNKSKDEPELGNPSSDGAIQNQDNRGECGGNNIHEWDKTDTEVVANILTNMEHIPARDGGVMAPPKVKDAARENSIHEAPNSSTEAKPELEIAGNRDARVISREKRSPIQFSQSNKDHFDPSGYNTATEPSKKGQANLKQDLSGSPPVFAGEYETADLNAGDQKGERSIQSCRLRTPSTDQAKSEQATLHATACARSEVSESEQNKSYTSCHAPKEEVNPVGDTESTIQPQRLSASSATRSRWRDREAYDQVGYEQPTTPDLLKYKPSGDDRDSFNLLRRPDDSIQSPQILAETVSSAPLSPVGGYPLVSLVERAPDVSIDAGNPIAFEKTQNVTTGSLPFVGQLERFPSPLPVENETVCGENQLFDDPKSTCDPSESHTIDENSDSSPRTPTEGQDLPVLPEPLFKQKIDDQELTTWTDGPGDWAALEDHDRARPSPKPPPTQEPRGLKQSGANMRIRSNNSYISFDKTPRPKVNIKQSFEHQGPLPPSMLDPPISLTIREDEPYRSHSDRSSHNTIHSYNQSPIHPQPSPTEVPRGQALPDQASSSSGKSTAPHETTQTSLGKPKGDLEKGPRCPKRRGRERKRSCKSPKKNTEPPRKCIPEK